MNIDWFTVVAQAINFLILVWLMKRFLYKPIINAIDTREKSIARELAHADARKAEAQEEHDNFRQKNDEFDKQRAALLSQATDEVKVERQRLLDEARKSADNLSARRQEMLINEANNLNKTISQRARQEVFAIARKALMDLGSASLEERLSEAFTQRLREMDIKVKEDLAATIKASSEPALLRSAFELPAEQRAVIQNALNDAFQTEIHIQFVIEPDLISGMEFSANGYKITWSISDYLESLEMGVDELIKEKDKPQAKAESEAPEPEVPEFEVPESEAPESEAPEPEAHKPEDTKPEKGADEHGI